jgi:N utilization substance protein B
METPEKHGKNSKYHSRRQARECVFQGLYAMEISRNSRNSRDKTFADMLNKYSFDENTKLFASSLYIKTLDQKQFLERTISKFLENWELGRIALLDNLILQMAVCELLFFDDVPPKVSISEAIEIAKKYSTDDSSGFVNGILDSVFQEVVKKNNISH